jgi:aspartate carbamoyltransferase catalytic subunit
MMGANVTVSGPPTMVPRVMEELGVKLVLDPKKAILEKDVVIVLRIQLERQGRRLIPSLREYARVFGISQGDLKKAKPDVILMHPGPINRGVELSPEVADSQFSVILEQVINGVAIRMAILYLLMGGAR